MRSLFELFIAGEGGYRISLIIGGSLVFLVPILSLLWAVPSLSPEHSKDRVAWTILFCLAVEQRTAVFEVILP